MTGSNSAGDVAALAELRLASLAAMRAALSVDQGIRLAGADIAIAAGLSEDILWSEWLNDTIGDLSRYDEAIEATPDAAYLAWLKERVTDKFRVSDHAEKRVKDRYSINLAMRMKMTVWDQELAWAHRNRSSNDADVVVLSQLFLSNTIKNPSKAFMVLADLHALALDDLDYIRAPEQQLQPAQIRAGLGSITFVPLYLRHSRAIFHERLATIRTAEMNAMAARYRKIEAAEVAEISRQRAMMALREARMSRMTGVIAVAMKRNLSADGLCEAERKFIALIDQGLVALPDDVTLPYSSFVAWLRTADHGYVGSEASEKIKKKHIRNEADKRLGAVDATLVKREAWINELPEEYIEIGGGRIDIFRHWIEPLIKKERLAPEDLILDFGFYLVNRSMRLVE